MSKKTKIILLIVALAIIVPYYIIKINQYQADQKIDAVLEQYRKNFKTVESFRDEDGFISSVEK